MNVTLRMAFVVWTLIKLEATHGQEILEVLEVLTQVHLRVTVSLSIMCTLRHLTEMKETLQGTMSISIVTLLETYILHHGCTQSIFPSRIKTPALPYTGSVCVRFSYHMYGEHMGSLGLSIQQGTSSSRRSSLWFKSGDQQDIWERQDVQVQLGTFNSRVNNLIPTNNNVICNNV